MTTKRETILTAITTLLTPTAGVSSRVYRSRTVALIRDNLPAILVEPVQDAHDNPLYGDAVMDSTLQFRVSVITRGDVPDQIADPIVQSAYTLLMANRSVSGNVMDMYMISTTFQAIEGDGSIGVTDMIFAAKYRANANTLAA